MIILGIDPGYAIVGWGVLEYQKSRFIIRGYGAITTPAGLPLSRRLFQIERLALRRRRIHDEKNRTLGGMLEITFQITFVIFLCRIQVCNFDYAFFTHERETFRRRDKSGQCRALQAFSVKNGIVERRLPEESLSEHLLASLFEIFFLAVEQIDRRSAPFKALFKKHEFHCFYPASFTEIISFFQPICKSPA